MKSYFTYTAIAAALMCSSAFAAEPVQVAFKKGSLVLGTESKSFSLKLNGRIMYDAGFVNSDEDNFVAENNFRRARIALKTSFNKTWAAKIDLEFADNEAELRDLWIAYTGLENFTFTIGNQKPHFSLDQLTSSLSTTFLERSMVSNASIPGRRVGLGATYVNDSVVIGATVFGDSIDTENSDVENSNGGEGVSENYSYSARAVYRPYINDDKSKVFQIGFNYLNLKPESDNDSEIRQRARLENSIIDPRPLTTGNLENVDERIAQGIEFLGKYNKFSFQGEYIQNTINRFGGESDVDTDGFYLETAYAIWGTGKKYKSSAATFAGVVPQSKKGALEVALRYSTLDLNDSGAGVLGGSADNVTLALNWYATNNVLIKLNHTISSLDENATDDGDFVGNDDVSITAIRFQLAF